MAYSKLISPNTFALTLKIHCKDCGRKLRNKLLEIQGVHTVKVNEKFGILEISGYVDPATILTVLENDGRKAELLWEQKSKNVQIITQSEAISPSNDPDQIIAQLQQLPGIPGLQHVEVTKTIKLTFQPDQPRNVGITNTTNNNANKPPHDHCSHIASGLCGASSSCCGGHSPVSHSHRGMTNGNCHGNSQYGSSPRGNGYALMPPGSEAGSLWPTVIGIPSAPPLPYDYYHAPPPAPPAPSYLTIPNNHYYSVFSDENVNGCVII